MTDEYIASELVRYWAAFAKDDYRYWQRLKPIWQACARSGAHQKAYGLALQIIQKEALQ